MVESHKERILTTVRGGNGLHGHEQPLAWRLIHILQPECGSHFRRAESQALFFGPSEDLLTRSTFRETEFLDSGTDEADLDPYLRQCELRLGHDALSPVVHLAVSYFDRLLEALDVLVGAKNDGTPNRIGRPRLLLTEKALEGPQPSFTVRTAELLGEILQRSSDFCQSTLAEYVV